ncbi:major facilitator superfamily transporter [Xylariaceae sp. FL0594]|nr:major facilitator superfamily transporter [Xylariaceae sp. FL0594]
MASFGRELDEIRPASLPNDRPAEGRSGSEEEDWQPTAHEKAIIYTFAILNLIVSLDATIIVTSMPTIVEDIGGSTTQAFWIGTSYLLVNAVSMPTICSVSDVFGRPLLLTISLVLFTIGTIVCCTAQNIGAMLIGRAIQGVGGGGIQSLSLVTQTDFVPLRWRPKWYGVTLGAWAVGLSTGPIVGGAIAERTTWRWIFYLMFSILGFGLVAIPYLLTLRPKERTALEKLHRVDWAGLFLFTNALTTFLIAISWGGTQYSWNSAGTLAPLIIGIVGLAGSICYEAFKASHPFLRKTLFHDVNSIVIYGAGALQGFMLYGTLYYVPFYFLSVREFGPIYTGVAMLPNALGFAVFGAITGRLVTRFNAFRWASWAVGSIAVGGYVAFREVESKAFWVTALLFGGLSHGAIITGHNFATQAVCKPGDEGAASAMYVFVRQLGIALGVGIGETTFQNALAMKLRWDGLPPEIAYDAATYIPTLHALPHGPQRDAIYDAYKFGFQIVYATWFAISVVALVLTLAFVKHADMNRKLESEHRLDSTRVMQHWRRASNTERAVEV